MGWPSLAVSLPGRGLPRFSEPLTGSHQGPGSWAGLWERKLHQECGSTVPTVPSLGVPPRCLSTKWYPSRKTWWLNVERKKAFIREKQFSLLAVSFIQSPFFFIQEGERACTDSPAGRALP